MAVKETVEGHGRQLQRVKIPGQAVAELMRDEIAGNALAIDGHAVVADDQIEFISRQDFIEPLILKADCLQQGGQTGGKGGQKESRTCVRCRIILKGQEAALGAFPLQEGQGIAAAAHSHLVPLRQKLLDDWDIPGGVPQPPAERGYEYMSHADKEISSDWINRFSYSNHVIDNIYLKFSHYKYSLEFGSTCPPPGPPLIGNSVVIYCLHIETIHAYLSCLIC